LLLMWFVLMLIFLSGTLHCINKNVKRWLERNVLNTKRKENIHATR